MIKNSKKILSLLLSLIMIMSMFTGLELTSFAEDDILTYLTYEINDGEVTIADCDSSISGDIVIPDTIEGYPVTTIGEYAFSWCTNLVSISIGSNITSIDKSAFRECNRLENIIIDENNNSFSIDEYGVLFNKDKTILIRVITNINRTEYIIPDSVTSIGDWAFYDCTNLASIAIPDSVTSIGNDAFASCDSLTIVTISNNVKTIGNEAFIGCNSLESVTIPDSVVSIGNHAFSECTSLTNLAIGNNVTSIGNCAFYACISLSGVTIPDSVTTIGNAAFHDCTGLKNVIIGNSVTTIGRSAFDGCNKLTKILIPDSVTTIEEKAFVGCTGISCIEIPATIEDIGSYAFGYVETDKYDVYDIMKNFEIKTFKNSEGASYAAWNDIPYYEFSEENGQISFSGYRNIVSENITIPETFRNKPVTAIGDGVFYGNEDLTSIAIPDTVTSIGKYAFYGCNNITEIDIPQGVTKIDNSAFEKCESLVSVSLPDRLESIGNYAFNCCANLTELTLPSGIKNIGNNAFLGCTGLTSLVIPEGAEYSEITYIEDQQIIDVAVSDNAFVKESVDLLPFDINSVDAVCEDGDYTLYVTVERKDGKPLYWSGDFEDEDSEPYYETGFEDVVYALYATKDNVSFEKFDIEIEISPEEYTYGENAYVDYFSDFNIKYIEEKDVYYISSWAYIGWGEETYTYGAFFDGVKITPLDRNYAKYHLLEIDDQYVLIENSFTHILDCELIETVNKKNKYKLSDTFYYYISDDLTNWRLIQGPERTHEQTYYIDDSQPVAGNIDPNQKIIIQNQIFDKNSILVRFRWAYSQHAALSSSDYAELYFSDNGIDFVKLEDYSDDYYVDNYFKYDDKLYCSINDCTNYNDSVWSSSSPCLIEYDKNGNIAEVIYYDYNIDFNYWYAYRSPGRFLQHGYSADDEESNRYTRFYDILPDGTVNSFLSNLDIAKMHNGISIGESELIAVGYGNNAFIVMEDFHKVYFVTTPFTFTHTYTKDSNLVFVGDEINSISENEILKAIGREPIEHPPVEDPPVEEPTTEEPTTEEPTTEEPTTEEPTTQEPTTEEPTTEEPTTEEPTTEEPTTQEPTTEEPTTQEPTTETPDDKNELEVKGEGGIVTDAENKFSIIGTGETADTVASMIENEYFEIVDKNGNKLEGNSAVGTGAKIQVINKDGNVVNKYTVIVPTDIDGNGKTTAADARLALRASAKIDTIDGVYAIAADSNNDNKITAMDARTILRKAAGLE